MRKYLTRGAAVLAMIAVGAGVRNQVRRYPSSAGSGLGLVPTVLDASRIDYREDEGGGRVVSGVVVELARAAGAQDDEARLTITPSALGPFVDPIPGLRGVRGANLHTARELERLFVEERIEIVTRRADDAGESAGDVRGAVRVARTGRVPERRRLPDGRIDYLAESRDVLPLALSLESGVLGRGDWHTEVRVDGVPRLAVDFAVREGGGEIASVRALSAHERDEVNP